jgi:hypothetical protein
MVNTENRTRVVAFSRWKKKFFMTEKGHQRGLALVYVALGSSIISVILSLLMLISGRLLLNTAFAVATFENKSLKPSLSQEMDDLVLFFWVIDSQ